MSTNTGTEGKFGNPIPNGSIEKGEGRTDKWADYVIFRAGYDGRHFEEFELRQDHGAWFGPPEQWTRNEVITAIDKYGIVPTAKGRFVTVDSSRLEEKGKIERGEEVLVVQIGNNPENRYLRTHQSMDDLEDLDRFWLAVGNTENRSQSGAR